MQSRAGFFRSLIGFAVGLICFANVTLAADDTARFNGMWKASILYNGQMITFVSVHEGTSFKNFVLLPQGSMPTGGGSFSAADGKWTITAATTGNDSGEYLFTNDDTAVCKNTAGVTVQWQRYKDALPPVIVAQAPAPMPKPVAIKPAPGSDVTPEMRADIQSKIKAGDDESALSILNQHSAATSPDPLLCITHAQIMLRMENYRQARTEMTLFLLHTLDNPDAYVVHAQASAAMGDQRWAEQDLKIAAQLRPATSDADRKTVATFAAMEPAGFTSAELPGQLDDLVKMAAAKQPYDALVKQAMRIVKGEWNIRKVEADEYRERKRQLVAATLADPQSAKAQVDWRRFFTSNRVRFTATGESEKASSRIVSSNPLPNVARPSPLRMQLSTSIETTSRRCRSKPAR